MDKELTFHIVIIKPPPNVDYGLQKGSGRNYETVQKQKSKSREDLSFKCVVKIKGERSKDHLPKLSGPFVQGRALDRFIYIGIGTFAGESDSKWSRRLKIPMTGISWDVVDRIVSEEKLMLESHVPGTGKDGSPNCGTVKPFDGWRIANRKMCND